MAGSKKVPANMPKIIPTTIYILPTSSIGLGSCILGEAEGELKADGLDENV
jgi:hypothetical protein